MAYRSALLLALLFSALVSGLMAESKIPSKNLSTPLPHAASYFFPEFGMAKKTQVQVITEEIPAIPVKVESIKAPEKSNIVRPSPGPFPSMYDNNIVVAYYGNPHSTRMGILGEGPLSVIGPKLKEMSAEYDAANGDDGVISAFHLIYGTVHADADVGILSDDKVLEFVQYGMRNNIIVVLDHQLGKYSVEFSMKRMLPWLQYPNVHLAIDPEWSTTNPGKEIGSIPASDVNLAMKMMQDYLVANNIKQRKMLMVHQFHYRMITNRETVDPKPYDRVDLIHNADGFGLRTVKLDTYRFIARMDNMPLKGFKLFFPKTWKTEGFDKPLMSPAEVMGLNPRPIFINYQ